MADFEKYWLNGKTKFSPNDKEWEYVSIKGKMSVYSEEFKNYYAEEFVEPHYNREMRYSLKKGWMPHGKRRSCRLASKVVGFVKHVFKYFQ